MKKIVVTGGSGKAGRATVAELLNHGYEVINADWVAPKKAQGHFVQTDLTNFEQTLDVMKDADAVVHLAAIPTTDQQPEAETYRVNCMSTFHVFNAAVKLGLKRVVWASSETCLGLPFKKENPIYAPLDESQPLYPESVYSLTKVHGEEAARHIHRWAGIPIIGLRFSNIMEPHSYAAFEGWQDDPKVRRWNLWSYVDSRDVGQSCRRGLESSFAGVDHFLITAADTCMRMDNASLMQQEFPGVPLKPGTGPHESLLSSEKARTVLGYEPQYSWRNQS